MPPNFESIGIPLFSRIPFTTMLQTVAKPTYPAGTETSPSGLPSSAQAIRSLTQMPALKAGFIHSNAFLKAFLGKKETFIGMSPWRRSTSSEVR